MKEEGVLQSQRDSKRDLQNGQKEEKSSTKESDKNERGIKDFPCTEKISGLGDEDPNQLEFSPYVRELKYPNSYYAWNDLIVKQN